jgi:uncharacterized protein (TIGR00369 family)
MGRSIDPPFHRHLGIRLVRQADGRAELALDLGDHLLNKRGVAHGGVIAALLDSALGMAVVSAIPPEWWCATTSLSLQFLRGARSGPVTAHGRVVRVGRRVAFAAGEIEDGDGVLATAHGTWHLWSQRPESGADRRTPGCVRVRGGEELRVGKILAVGRNYAEHIAEMGAPPAADPVVFLKPATSLAAGVESLRIPTAHGEVHHEVELVAVIGAGGREIPAERALDHVLGWAVGIDLTLRDVQKRAKERGEPWTLAKGFDGAAPVSDVIPKDEVGPADALDVWLDVNGERRQSGSTRQMLFSVPRLIEHVSRLVTLERGDLLFTGTPAGVGPLRPGDRVEAGIERVATLRFVVTA